MKCCTFCSTENQMLFSNQINYIGSLCIDCYMQLQGSCGICGLSFIPNEVKENVTYQIKAKFINMGESVIVCDSCFKAIRQAFPEQMA
jgi:hypothetical protein